MFSNGCERAPSVSNIIQRLIVMIVMVMVIMMVMVMVVLGAGRVMVMVMGIMVVAVGRKQWRRMIAGTQQVTDSGDSNDDNFIAETMIMTITVMMLGSVGEL